MTWSSRASVAGLAQRDEPDHLVRPDLPPGAAGSRQERDEGRQLVRGADVVEQRGLDAEPPGEGAEDALGRLALPEQRAADGEAHLVRGRLVRSRSVHRRPQVTSRRSEMKTAATLTTAM